MAVAPASMADKIIVLDGDDDDEESPQPSCFTFTSACKPHAKPKVKAQQPVPTHITQSPFASAKKATHVLQAENQRLFAEVSLHVEAQSGGFNQGVWSVFSLRCLLILSVFSILLVCGALLSSNPGLPRGLDLSPK